MPIADVIKSLIDFLANRQNQPLWNYEDITAKVWSVRSAEHIDIFLQHVLRVFRDSLPHAHINERWAQTALQLGLSCSSRHYAGRSLQIFRSLRVPITSRMLSDILSRLVETVAEQGEDMQGYVTELLLTLEAAVDSLESDFRPLDFMKEIFKSTPNLNNKDMVVIGGKRSPGGECVFPNAVGNHIPYLNQTGHTRSTSYSVSYCLRKGSASPASDGKDLRCRGSNDVESRCNMNRYVNKFFKFDQKVSLSSVIITCSVYVTLHYLIYRYLFIRNFKRKSANEINIKSFNYLSCILKFSTLIYLYCQVQFNIIPFSFSSEFKVTGRLCISRR